MKKPINLSIPAVATPQEAATQIAVTTKRWMRHQHDYTLLGTLEQREFFLIFGLTILPFLLAAFHQIVISCGCVLLLVSLGFTMGQEDKSEDWPIKIGKSEPVKKNKRKPLTVETKRRYRSTSRKGLCSGAGALLVTTKLVTSI